MLILIKRNKQLNNEYLLKCEGHLSQKLIEKTAFSSWEIKTKKIS